MQVIKIGVLVGLFLTLAIIADAQPAQTSREWGGCCGVGRWSMGPGPSRHGPMPRHHAAMMQGIPAPYDAMRNPLPVSEATVSRGAAVYATHCVACHGESGRGDGPAGRDLSPPPGNLAWLSRMPMARWDAFMYWSIAEGGAQFTTSMPAFKDALSQDEIWSVIAYVQARLPQDTE